MSEFLSEKFLKFEAYVPGEQPIGKKLIKLNTNESPYPPSQKVIDAVNSARIQDLRLYSDINCTELKIEFAKLYGVSPENLFFGNGSDEILNFSFMAFGTKKNEAAFPEISYGFYKVFSELYGIKYEAVPLKNDFSIDPSDYLEKGKFIVIANPNAPTGGYLPPSEIEKIVQKNPDNIVLIDEAYIDFGGESCYPLIKKYKNLLVCGTFSKSRSMAGARLGFAIADKAIIDDLERIKFSTNPYNVNSLTQAVGAAAINDNDYFMENCKRTAEIRDYTKNKLRELGFNVLPSKANFLFAESPKIDGKELYLRLRERDILIRHFNLAKINNFNRITIGLKSQMDTLISAITEILEEK